MWDYESSFEHCREQRPQPYGCNYEDRVVGVRVLKLYLKPNADCDLELVKSALPL